MMWLMLILRKTKMVVGIMMMGNSGDEVIVVEMEGVGDEGGSGFPS